MSPSLNVFIFWMFFIGAPLLFLSGDSPQYHWIGFTLLIAHSASVLLVSRRIGFGRLNLELLDAAAAFGHDWLWIFEIFRVPFFLYLEFWRLVFTVPRIKQ